MAHAVHNEQTKLFAGMLDRVGTVCLAVGAATPVSGALLGVPGVAASNPTVLLASTLLWVCMFTVLHILAQYVLKGLRE